MVYLIAADFHTEAANIELEYAMKHSRCRCFAVYDETRSKEVQNYDPPVYNALAKALADVCDVVAVAGNRITRQMMGEVKIAAAAGKKIYVTKDCRSLLEKSIKLDGLENIELYYSLDCPSDATD